MHNNKFNLDFPESHFKKVTILYADDIQDITVPLVYSTVDMIHESYFLSKKVSDRVEYVKDLSNKILSQFNNYYIITNDYTFIKLLEMNIPKNELCIYNYDQNCVVDNFISLEPNPTLDIYDMLFRKTIEECFPIIE